MKADKDIDYVNKATQRIGEFRSFNFTLCREITTLDVNSMTLFRIRNYIREKRWAALAAINNFTISRSHDWFVIYACEDASKTEYVVVIFDPLELWTDSHAIIIEKM